MLFEINTYCYDTKKKLFGDRGKIFYWSKRFNYVKVVPVLLESAEFKDVLVKEIKLEDGPEHNPLLNTEHDQLHNSDWDMMKQEDFIQDDHYDHKVSQASLF